MNQIKALNHSNHNNRTSDKASNQARTQASDHQSLLSPFGSAIQRVEKAIASLRAGNGLLLVDDEDRENEGDLIFSTDFLTESQMAMLIRECSGIVCLCLTEQQRARLNLPMMTDNNTSQNGTAFTISIEASSGVTTGVSASDRVTTIKAAVSPDAKPADLNHPGHVFPLLADSNGVLTRRGHTEGTVDLMRLANLSPSGVLCELTNPDGTMARLPEIIEFAHKHSLPVLSVEDIVAYRTQLQKRSA